MEDVETIGSRGNSHSKWTNPDALNSVVILLSSIKANKCYFQNKGRNKEPKEIKDF